MSKVPVKRSIGIILCNYSPGKMPEVLLVHKRYTYAFMEFVHGKYAHCRYGITEIHKSVAKLLTNMTCEELLIIWSLNFQQMWYHIWLDDTLNKELFQRKNCKFQSIFMRADGGESLRKLIKNIRAVGTLLWEIPKGKHSNSREEDINCAVRELYEETGVNKNSYRILPNIKKNISYISNGNKYEFIYYVAIANSKTLHRHPTIRDINHIAEISEVKWHNIEQIRVINTNPQLQVMIKSVFNYVKKYINGVTRFEPCAL